MKLHNIFIILLFLTVDIYSDSAVSNGTDINSTVLSQGNEIKMLNAKIKKLEAELANCKKVKPVATAINLVSIKKELKPETKQAERFVWSDKPPKKLSAYFTAAYQEMDELSVKLEENGFKLLAVDEILEGKNVLSFSSESLIKTNSFMAVLHLLINERKEIRVQNPSYFAAAYLGEEYTYGDFNSTVHALQNVLGEMYITKDIYSLNDLSDYNFMLGMPKLDDTIIVGKGDDLISKLTKEDMSRYVSYIVTLPNGSVLVGQKLQKSTYEYLLKINASDNAQLFPYEVMIEKNRAYMLAPKYYLALSLPRLSMTDFMKIASAPEEIIKDIKQAYK